MNPMLKALMRRHRGLTLAILIMLLAGALAGPATRTTTAAPAAQGCRTFPETGQTVCGKILAYWNANGGLPVFGYPRSEQYGEVVEGVQLQVQWFERDRLEIQPNGTITAGRLGAAVLEGEGRYVVPGPDGPSGSEADCRTFGETGYTACGIVLDYWNRNGGLARFGFPITGLQQEVIGGKTIAVQWFERRRVELHSTGDPNNPIDILLGLLGCQVSGLCPAS